MRKIILYVLPAVVMLCMLSCTFSAKATRQLLQKAENSGPFDVIIVPGIPFKDGKWDHIMKGRVYWSKYLFDKGIAKNIIYSGSSVYTAYYEAEIMALYAKAIGIPGAHIYTETKAEHSTENAYYGSKRAQQLGFKRVALASDAFQTKLLRSYIRKKVNKDMALIPMVIDTMKAIEPAMIDPEIHHEQAFNPGFVSIKERESWWKRLKGTIRGNMDTTAYSVK
ncbi:YdcF family protein [Agriterribacter sp.]|uniref:YdcF family protein n=1 Tax=Agriterribacter sp. TaxID=2821509 RepID=UPI002C74E5B8|nr:YdcF family protein [Agriterribacter sp.]HTN08928.1 YdcF family protein [Agriterribacter sp.]